MSIPLTGAGSSGADFAASAETQAFLDRLPTLPSAGMRTIYNTFINGLVAAGIYDAFDALYLFTVETSSASCVNLVQDRFPLDVDESLGDIDFTALSPTPANAGWLGPSNGCLVSYENLLSASGLVISQNDASIFCWNKLGQIVASYRDVRSKNIGGSWIDTLSIIARYPADDIAATINCAGGDITYNEGYNADGSGFYLMQRTGATTQVMVKDTTVVPPDAGGSSASVALPDAFIASLAQRHTRAFGFGRSLTTQERTDLYDLISAFIISTAGGIP